MIKNNTPGIIPGRFYVPHETSLTVKLTGDELATGLAGGLGDDDCKILSVHEGNDVREIALESGGNGVVLLLAADDGKNGLFRSFGVHVSVQRPCVNRDTLAVLEVFNVQPRVSLYRVFLSSAMLEMLVSMMFIFIFLSGLSFISTGRPSPIDKPISGLFRQFVKFVRHFNPCAVS